jgi:hypothetical protein
LLQVAAKYPEAVWDTIRPATGPRRTAKKRMHNRKTRAHS